jgi:hypothetical protein
MLLKAILFIILSYFALKFIFRYLFPFLITKQAGKMQHQQKKARQDYVNQRKSEEGKVTIEYNNTSNKKKGTDHNKDGEYIDFEEIK